MSDNFSSVGSASTSKSYNELSPPKVIQESEKVMKKLKGLNGDDIFTLFSMLETISEEIQNTKQSDLDTLWERVEKKLYNGKTLKTTSGTDKEKLNTLIGTFFLGLQEVDATNNIESVRAFGTMFNDLRFFAEKRFIFNYEGRDRLATKRVLNLTDTFLGRVNKRYNSLVDQELMPGPKL
jgi:hypothetical protein